MLPLPSRFSLRRAAFVAPFLVGLATFAPAADAAPAKARLTATLSASAATAGQAVTLSGKVRPAARRTVRLERRAGKTWTAIASTTSARKGGTFTLTVPTSAVGTITVRAQAPKKGSAKTLVSAVRTVKVSAPAAPAPVPTPTPGPTVTPPCCKTNPAPIGVVTTPSAARPSFRAIYAVAADQSPAAGKGPAIAASAEATNAWFGTQTTGNVRPRWVRDGAGAIVVTTVTLPRAAAAYATASFSSVVAELQAAAPVPADQKTVLWFDVGSPNGCGVTGSGLSVLFEDACDIHPSTTDVFPYGATYLTAHEMTHNFGAVPSCAPHSGGGGHVIDDPRDVLYNGTQQRVWSSITLDPGHDDYYATGNAACPGIESSPYWTATSDPLS